MLNIKLKYMIFFLAVIAVLGLVLFGFLRKNIFNIEKGSISLEGMSFSQSNLAGIRCENAKSRPMAVMLSSDPEARPLAGISQADMVFEMPVTEGGVTRMMAVFQCYQPEEIGSIRSSRLDFIPLVESLDAVYAHWGGEKDALAELDRGITDNIDGLKYEGTTYYRKAGLKPPHNGFTSFDLLKKATEKLGYSLSKSLATYPYGDDKSLGQNDPPGLYKGNFLVNWKYDPNHNTYLRWRNDKAETDRNNSRQVEAKNVILLKTTWSPIDKDYIRIRTIGSGEAVIYQNGQVINGSWEKKDDRSKLYFFDDKHQEVRFSPGPVWVEVTI